MGDVGAGTDRRAAACGAHTVCVKLRMKLAPPQTGRNAQSSKTDELIVECHAVGSVHP